MPRITLRDFAEAMSSRTKLTKSASESTLRAVFELIGTHLYADNYVKIKGLGVFKLLTVRGRESVSVNTGERIEIASHSRISFTPDKALAERINKPFSSFQTVTIDDSSAVASDGLTPTETISEAASPEDTPFSDGAVSLSQPSVDQSAQPQIAPSVSVPPSSCLLQPAYDAIPVSTAYIGDDEAPETDSTDVAQPHASAEEQTSPDTVAVTDQLSPEDASEQSALDSQEDTGEAVSESSDRDAGIQQDGSCEPNTPAPSETIDDTSDDGQEGTFSATGRRGWLIVFCIVLAGVCGYLLGYYRVFVPQAASSSPSAQVQKPQATSSPQRPKTGNLSKDTVKRATHADSVRLRMAAAQADSVALEKRKAQLRQESRKYNQMPSATHLIAGTYKVHTMKSGESLIRLSKQIYGSKEMAKYVVFYNGLSNPDVVPVGTKVRFPLLVSKQ